jgi:uncharacterized RDD family membrane protein YckC
MDEQPPASEDEQPTGETPPAPPPIAPPPPPPIAPPVSWSQAPAPATGIPVPGSAGVFLAGMWQRFAAYLLDNFLLVLAYIVVAIVVSAAGFGGSTATGRPPTGATSAGTVILALASAAYFILQWRGGHRATFGMRAVGIQVGNAFDGVRLTDRQAFIRWAALGYPLGLIGLIPGLSGLAGLINIVLVIGLFLTTLGSTTRQGWHDQFANSAVVRRPGSTGSNTAAIVIVLVVLLLLIIPVFAIVGLIFMGGAISNVLSTVGTSIQQ